jgi:DNA repair protein RadC
MSEVIAVNGGYALQVRDLYVVRERATPPILINEQICKPESVANIVRTKLEYEDEVETFHVLLLTQNAQIIGIHTVGKGTVNAVLINPGSVFRAAILANAPCIVIVHTHPSGNIEPSQEDITLTRQLMSAAKMLDIRILDHVIVGLNTDRYYSFVENNSLY